MGSSSFSEIAERVGKFDANRPALRFPDGKVYTEGQLRNLKNDPRYWRAVDVDRGYQAWVDKLYEIAYSPDR